MPGPTELMIIGGIALLLFGPTMLPKFAKSLGETVRELRKSSAELKQLTHEDNDET